VTDDAGSVTNDAGSVTNDAGSVTNDAGSVTDDAGSVTDDAAARPMGHGVNQRAQIKMTEEEIDSFLRERRPITLCSINHDGSIHAIAMWYGFLEGALAFETKAKSQKTVNLRRDSRITCMAEEGDYYEELRGVELVGRAEIVEEPERMWELGVSVFERYQGPYSEAMRPFVETMLHKRVVVKLHVERVVSWDHRKLGLPSTRPEPVRRPSAS
jgi:PPOX class probable F420-dependent enzyme